MAKDTTLKLLEDFAICFPECVIIALADVSTGLVLASSGQPGTAQEHVDAIGEKASSAFQNAATGIAELILSKHGYLDSRVVVSFSDRGVLNVFVSRHAGQEALCIVFDKQIQDAQVLRRAADLMDSLLDEP